MKFKKKFRIGIAFSLVFMLIAINFGNKIFVKALGTDDYVVGTNNLNNTTENSAKIMDSLPNPEIGWKRYNDSNSNITYSSLFTVYNNDTRGYLNDFHYKSGSSTADIGKIQFNFTGTKLRIIALTSNVSAYDNMANITIDGNTQTFSELSTVTTGKYTLVFENIALSNTEHSVVISSSAVAKSLTLDAIDIDENGDLKPYNANPVQTVDATGIALDKTSLDMNIGDITNLIATVTPDNATNKNVTWTSSDSSIATVDSTGKVTAIKEGSVTITATTSDGSNKSATCTINVKNPVSGNGLLTVTMTDGQQRSYDLTMSQINDFITWYNNRAGGQGSFTYSFNKTPSSAAYTKRTEYLIFDKISNYDVDEYKTN
jgi:uncharacterized protein YjdB